MSYLSEQEARINDRFAGAVIERIELDADEEMVKVHLKDRPGFICAAGCEGGSGAYMGVYTESGGEVE